MGVQANLAPPNVYVCSIYEYGIYWSSSLEHLLDPLNKEEKKEILKLHSNWCKEQIDLSMGWDNYLPHLQALGKCDNGISK